ncbi:hypothetical protein SBRCBS47491_005493 [Sporothrix bragantina]|uniref:Uncharacterized protein n=1 Tax=Sporothrix bragantina TaxID=671064 RepID=A0ABP0BXD1_9PEZI
MPSRNSFSIRKLFSSPRRVSLFTDETAGEHFDAKRRSNTSTNSGTSASGASDASRGSRGSRISQDSLDSHASHGSSSSTAFHPDSSFTITTPQAERGLTDNVDHELSQEEIDRIKAVVAAAAAAAASSLRLRMDEGSEPSRTVQTIRTIEMTMGDVGNERNVHTDLMTTKKQTKSDDSADTHDTNAVAAERRVETTAKTNSPSATQTIITSTPQDDKKPLPRKKIRRIPQPIVVPPRPTPRPAGARPPRRPTGAADGPTNNAAAYGPKHPQHAGNSQTAGDGRLCPDGVENDKQQAVNTQSKQSATTKQASHADDAAGLRGAVWAQGDAALSSSSRPRSSTVGASSTRLSTKTRLSSPSSPSPPSLSLYSTIPLASIMASRKSLPALPPHSLTKALPPPPPPRVSSYFGTRSPWKSKSDKSLLSITTTAATLSSTTKTEKTQKTEKTADALAHPLYRGQKREPDGKKDSGIALDRSQTSLVGKASSSDAAYEAVSDTADDADDADDAGSGSDAGSCIDLLQALAIQPEEADNLRRQTFESISSSTQKTPKSKNMDASSHLKVDGSADNTAAGAALRDVCTTPTFTQPRMAPTPSPSAIPSAANTPRRVMSPSSSPRPSLMGSSRDSLLASLPPPPAATAASPPSPKKQTRFLPLRLNKGLPDAALRIQRKKSTKKPFRKRVAVAAKGQTSESKGNTNNGKGNTNNGKGNTNNGKGGNSNSNNGSNNDSNSGGSSRWTLPENVTELFNGRLFNRMEVNETLPFEKLQAIRESRALAQKQQEEAEEKKKAKQLQDELDEREKRERQDRERQDKKRQQDLLDAEQALIQELQQHSRPQPEHPDKLDTASTPPLETLVECEEEEMQVSPLDPEDESTPIDANGNRIQIEAPTPVSPPTDNYPSPQLLPPILPMPPHIALQMVWPGDEVNEEAYSPDSGRTVIDTPNNDSNNNTITTTDTTSSTTISTKTLFLNVNRDEPDGSMTPIEPFHMQDLPSRIGAAGVRVSILLPVEEEEALFASSVAQHKERRRREQEEREREEQERLEREAEADDVNFTPSPPKSPLDEVGPFPSPPTKNPMRFQSFIKKAAMVPTNRAAPPPPLTQPTAQPIPQVTVTDVDNNNNHGQSLDPDHKRRSGKLKGKGNGKTKSSHKSDVQTPKSTFFFPPSALSVSSSTSSIAALAAASGRPHLRDDATYCYLAATPFSLVMPTYRHGPIRLNRADLEELRATNSRNSYDRSHCHPGMANIATVDETLDWTAFQMAILGGAGDLFQEGIDYGQIAVAEADEADQLADWFCSLDLRPGKLFKSAKDDKEWIYPTASANVQPLVKPTAPAAPAAPTSTPPLPPSAPLQHQQVHMHHTQRTAGSQWSSVGSSIHTTASSNVAPAAGVPARGFSHSRTATSTSICTVASGYSSSYSSSSHDNSNSSSHRNSAQAANLALPFPMSRSNSAAAGDSKVVVLPPPPPPPPPTQQQQQSHRPPYPPLMAAEPRTMETVRASFASFASYESMPQSPMADLIMTRGADGKEYVAPMGYNLSHDLGDYLLWEQENVYSMTP